MGIARRTAYRWAGDVKLTIAEHLKRICSDAELANRWERQYQATRGNARTRVLENLTKIRAGYPAPGETPQDPVTVIFNTDLSQYEGLVYGPDRTKIPEQGQ
jgi:hypothetical protein